MEEKWIKKLKELEITPSERAHQLFLSKLEESAPKKAGYWKYFATAASVVMALGFLYYMQNHQEVLQHNTTAVLPKTPEKSEIITPVAPVEEEINLPPVVKTPTLAAVHQTETFTYEEEIIAPKINQTVLREEVALKELNPEISYRYHSTNLRDFTIVDALVPLEIEREEVQLTQMDVPEPKPLLAKVVKEIQYVKQGEKPDLDRAGIKPAATLMAKNGLLANESRQIKEGVQRFKELFR
ncbi:hypothetical protein [Leadbetterella byssophila]|uniref:Uncharacterized protein n=1 Tax=Leadbetterella byssophila (strain DSM 17132 / JCM 16389 / KACC 11308 / NBRC 106382 / 4M15) TaxID=649349 RepID=E4RX25_LEAB4|nr:hypothetical protein [Leadbetterella byssophila]ADQ18064.1 hypothetical protein Lbys_2388 [Leadbetterella byssophila DSM 17132]